MILLVELVVWQVNYGLYTMLCFLAVTTFVEVLLLLSTSVIVFRTARTLRSADHRFFKAERERFEREKFPTFSTKILVPQVPVILHQLRHCVLLVVRCTVFGLEHCQRLHDFLFFVLDFRQLCLEKVIDADTQTQKHFLLWRGGGTLNCCSRLKICVCMLKI